MIILSFECSGEQVERYDRYQDYYFVIPELLEDELYKDYMIKTSKYIMLDNGMYERGYPDADSLISNAREIGARELVLPDYLYEREKTVRATGVFLDGLSKDEINEFRWMAVPQGDTIPEWIRAYKEMHQKFDDVTYSIGIPRCPHKEIYYRTVAIQTLQMNGELVDKPHHMLGLNDPSELLYLGFVRSCDTGWPFKLPKHKGILRRINLLRKLSHEGYTPKQIADAEEKRNAKTS